MTWTITVALSVKSLPVPVLPSRYDFAHPLSCFLKHIACFLRNFLQTLHLFFRVCSWQFSFWGGTLAADGVLPHQTHNSIRSPFTPSLLHWHCGWERVGIKFWRCCQWVASTSEKQRKHLAWKDKIVMDFSRTSHWDDELSGKYLFCVVR